MEKPIFEIVKFQVDDIITTSGGDLVNGGEGGETGGGSSTGGSGSGTIY